MSRGQAKLAGTASLAMLLCWGAVARADQGGVSFWVPGIHASMAAVPPDPGFSMPSTLYFYSGKAESSRNFAIGGLIATGVEVKDFEGVFLAPTWVPEEPVAGGRLALSMMGVVANNEVSANINFDRIPVSISRTDDTFGIGDLYPQGQSFLERRRQQLQALHHRRHPGRRLRSQPPGQYRHRPWRDRLGRGLHLF
jgi:hypothetical protein